MNKIQYWIKSFNLYRSKNPEKTTLFGMIILSAIICVVSLFALTYKDYQKDKEIASIKELKNFDDFIAMAKEGKIETVQVFALSYIMKNPQTYNVYTTKSGERFKASYLVSFDDNDEIKPYTQKIYVEPPFRNYGQIRTTVVGQILFLCLFGMVIIFAQMIFTQFVANKNFAPEKLNLKLTFDDIVGYDDVKKELNEFKKYFENKKLYSDNDINLPKGLLLTGMPGVGKTMFAKALANELKCNFLLASGSDFVELYVGVGPKRIRSLFSQAKILKPTIIFIDEIDAIGSRSFGFTDSERLSTINQILTEMDGVVERDDVIVIGATNYADKLDKALLRPGRFDKQIHIPLPDLDTRHKMIERFLNKSKHENVDIEKYSHQFSNFSGAEIKNIIDEAKVIAFQENPDSIIIKNKQIDQALQNIAVGIVSSKHKNVDEIRRIALHELGHAIAAKQFLPNAQVHKVSIIGRGRALGFTLQTLNVEQKLNTKQNLESEIKVLLAGRAAEEVMLGDVSNGAENDIERAFQIASNMVVKWGMSDAGFVGVVKNSNVFDEKLFAESTKILNSLYTDTKEFIQSKKEILEKYTDLLIEQEEMDGKDLFV